MEAWGKHGLVAEGCWGLRIGGYWGWKLGKAGEEALIIATRCSWRGSALTPAHLSPLRQSHAVLERRRIVTLRCIQLQQILRYRFLCFGCI